MAEIKKKAEPSFTKKQLCESEKYAAQKDLLDALLDNKKTYTQTEADNLILKFLKGKVSK